MYLSSEPDRVKESCELNNEDLNNSALDDCVVLNWSKTNVILIGSNHNRIRVLNDIDLDINLLKISLVPEAKNKVSSLITT